MLSSSVHESYPFPSSISSVSFILLLPLSIFYVIYRLYLEPLSNIPGPLLCRLTPLWSWYHSSIGDECSQIDALHDKYGPVVRIGPHDVVISDGAALAPIYSEKGGFLKAPCYSNFDLEGHETIFSTLNPKQRSVRSKAVMPMFSTASIRERSKILDECVDALIARLEEGADRSKRAVKEKGDALPVNVLNLARGFSLDAVTAYLFGANYGGLQEQTAKFSASHYVESFVETVGFFFFPKWLFVLASEMYFWLHQSPERDESTRRVNDFTGPLSRDSPEDGNTYQGRLLKAGISTHETDAQMKDVIFAGTDTTGMNLGKLIFQLAKHPFIYRKLQAEIASAEAENPNYDPQKLEYLQAVVREGLRTSLANPTRLPRQVPPSGWTYSASDGKTYHLPGGTVVGLSPQTLHFNPKVFPDPHAFDPDRWINDPSPEMFQDWIPFGLGPRQCIARNLAMAELTLAARALAKSDVLRGARGVKDKLRILEGFNSRVVGETIDLVWEDE